MDSVGRTSVVGRTGAVSTARAGAEASMAVLDRALDTSRAGAARLLDALPDANPSKGHQIDTYA